MKHFILIGLFLGLSWMGCKEAQPLVGTTEFSKLSIDTLYAKKDTFLIKGRTSTAGSPKLLLGSNAGYQTQVLLHFIDLPDDTVQVDSLYLRLHSWSNYGNAGASITGNIHLITEEWEESINETGELATQPLESEPFIITTDSISHRIILPASLMNTWRDTTGGNHNFGLMLDFSDADFIKEFYSGNTIYPPELSWTYHQSNSDSIIRDTTFATLDASLIDFSGTLDSQALFVTAGYAIHSFIQFDFSTLPKNINISYINFEFTHDSDHSDVNGNKNQNFQLVNVITPFDMLSYESEIIIDEDVREDLFLLEDQNNTLLVRDKDQLKKTDTGRYYIQDILGGIIEHDSFLLMYTYEGYDASIYALKRSENGKNAPRIIIGYNTLIPPRL
jgi:hypothetical protein